jgi:superfamily II DNA or RNA helicase
MIHSIKFPINMNTSEYNFRDDFYKPLLENMSTYYRGVGYFSSGWIKQNADGLFSFIEKGGSIKWITSPILSEEDFASFSLGEEARNDVLLKERLSKTIDDLEIALSEDTLTALSWMIADGLVDIRIAVPCGKLSGEFHDKFGYFEDTQGNCLSFNGSNNESINGIESNYESFTIFYSWHENDEIKKISRNNRERFFRLWNNEDENIRIYSIPDSVKEQLLKLRKSKSRPYSISKHRLSGPQLPDIYKVIRDYQREAFEEWKSSNFSGVFAMATGTGKTVTSLYCALREYEERFFSEASAKYQLIVLVPSKTLVKQWSAELANFRFFPVICADSDNPAWKSEVKKIIDDSFYMKIESNYAIIVTYTSFIKSFQTIFSKLSEDSLFIADEVHNLGSPNALSIIDQINFKRKIGLSATPKRIYAPESSMQIEEFFNSSYPYTFSYSMTEAIENGVLTKYNYFVRFTELDDEEFDEYCRLTNEIGFIDTRTEKTRSLTDAQKMKLIKRKAIINGAKSKRQELSSIIEDLHKLGKDKYCLVYAPSGSDYFDSDEDSERIIIQMQKMIKNDFPMIKLSSYLGETKDRNRTIESFKNGNIDILFAINCLDEGVDIPRTEIGIFTSSSGNPRQFIQRRGRLLRKHKEKEKAIVYDMITIPPLLLKSSANQNIARNLILNELRRARYFVQLSEQRYEFYDIFEPILEKYQLSFTDINIDEEFL